MGGKLALGQTGAGGTGGEEILRGEVAEPRPVEIAVFSNPVIERRSIPWMPDLDGLACRRQV